MTDQEIIKALRCCASIASCYKCPFQTEMICRAMLKSNEAVHNKMETAVKDMLCEEFGDIATVKVTKSFADLYRTEEKHETY